MVILCVVYSMFIEHLVGVYDIQLGYETNFSNNVSRPHDIVGQGHARNIQHFHKLI